ncbi:unnamed protein product [Schistosoma margrebowiei]|uniref:Uncharacterized protein n=1 Tax=Schistosoma margrebowiei TaxID=48269 RepID=A0A183MTE4_9TREM|nr:unnamed protein product [Schistosoma margrebowiei]
MSDIPYLKCILQTCYKITPPGDPPGAAAPTNDCNEDAKDRFYDRLQSIIEKCPTRDLNILMGDFNAKVGMNNTGYEDIMERQGLEERTENGERFANLCAFNKLVIGGTIFPNKCIHKTT